MKRVAVKLDDLVNAFLFVSAGRPFEHEAYLSVETGVIHYWSQLGSFDEELPDDIVDPEKYIAIPHKNDLDLGKRLALRFVEDLLPDDLHNVHRIFSRKSAYSRFKSLLEDRGMLQQWYEYEEKCTKQALLEWCEQSGIEIND